METSLTNILIPVYLVGILVTEGVIGHNIWKEGIRDNSYRRNGYSIAPHNLRGSILIGFLGALFWPIMVFMYGALYILVTITEWVKAGNHQ